MTGDATSFLFSGYRLETVTRELYAPDGAAVPLTSKAFDVLLHLIEHRGRMVGKDELLAEVWPGRVVDENNLTQAVSALRRAFGTGGGDHRYIVTVPGRGYRFVAELDRPATMPADAAPVEAVTKGRASLARQWGRLLLIVGLFALVWLAIVAWRGRTQQSDGSDRDAVATLAVMPFRAIGGTRDEMLELGMAETLIARLSQSTRMRVLSLSSVQGFAGASADPLRAGMAMGADYVLDGSTQWRGDAIRINARLLSLPDGRTVWAGTFDHSPEQVFVLQDEIAQNVSSVLSLKYAAPLRRSPCDGEDADAYRAYLRGRYLINRPGERNLTQALAAFGEAIERDPACARAWAGSAFARRALVMTADRDPREQFPLSNAAIARALAIDPQSAEAYAAKGFNQFWYDWDWAGAEASLRRALAINPNLPDAHFALAHLLNNIGRSEEAAVHARQAVGLDPMSPLVNLLAAGFVGNAGHFEESRRRGELAFKLEPDYWTAVMVRSLRQLGRDNAAAIKGLQRAVELSGRNSRSLATLGNAYVEIGDRASAETILRELQTRDSQGYVPATNLATLHVALGHHPEALDLLERGYRDRDVSMSFLMVEYNWRPLRAQPRFQALMRRMNLPLAQASAKGD